MEVSVAPGRSLFKALADMRTQILFGTELQAGSENPGHRDRGDLTAEAAVVLALVVASSSHRNLGEEPSSSNALPTAVGILPKCRQKSTDRMTDTVRLTCCVGSTASRVRG